MTARKEEKVSELATLSVNHVVLYAAVIHSLRRLISLSVSQSPSL